MAPPPIVLVPSAFQNVEPPAELPDGLALTGAMLVVAIAAGVFFRGLDAPRARARAGLGLVLALVAAGLVVATVLAPEPGALRRSALGAAALVGGLGLSVYFAYGPLKGGGKRRVSRGTLGRAGLLAAATVVAGLLLPAPWPAVGAAAGALLVLAALGFALPARTPPEEVLHGETWLPSVRFPCPRCGAVEDWPDAVAPCPTCGLFVHIEWDPERDPDEPARFAPEDPAPGTCARFRCLGCRNEVDWLRGTTVCAVCGKRLRMHWNVHA